MCHMADLAEKGTILVNFFFFLPCSMRDLNSLTRGRTCARCREVQSLNHWATRDVPWLNFYLI